MEKDREIIDKAIEEGEALAGESGEDSFVTEETIPESAERPAAELAGEAETELAGTDPEPGTAEEDRAAEFGGEAEAEPAGAGPEYGTVEEGRAVEEASEAEEPFFAEPDVLFEPEAEEPEEEEVLPEEPGPEELARRARRERALRAAEGRSLAEEGRGQTTHRRVGEEATRVGSPRKTAGGNTGVKTPVSGERRVRKTMPEGEKMQRHAAPAAGDSGRPVRNGTGNRQSGNTPGKRRPQSETGSRQQVQKRRLVTDENGGRTAEQRRRQEGRTNPRPKAAGQGDTRPVKASGNRPSRKKGRGLVIGLSAAILLLITALGLCIWLLFSSQNGGSSPLSAFTREKQTAPVIFTEAEPSVKATEAAAAQTSPAAEESGEEAGQPAQAAPSAPAAAPAAPAGEPTEAQTWQEDANGTLILPERQPGSFETEPAWESTLALTGDALLDEANRQAAMYDYDKAIVMLQGAEGYDGNQSYKDAVAGYEAQKAEASVPYASMNTITHIFFHSLIVDTSLALDREKAVSKWDGGNKMEAYNSEMTTVTEFCRILDEMYRRGYVLVGLHDIAGFVDNADGTRTMQYKQIYLPAGKTPFVLSVDDTSYYMYMEGHGFASKLVVDANGKVVNEYVHPDGTVSYGAYDVLPILEDFITAHPDFCYRGARGTMALTGYEGILGYRTSDYWFNWNCDYIKPTSVDFRNNFYYNNENIEQDKQTARQVAEAIKAMGWTFASHTWGHRHILDDSYEQTAWDTEMWHKEVEPLTGPTDIIIFAFGQDLDSWRGYAADNQKYQLLKSYGFDYFCNVDSSQYWIQIGANKDYFRMGRRNLDGYRLWEAISSYAGIEGGVDRVSDLVDPRAIFDWSRETPVLMR